MKAIIAFMMILASPAIAQDNSASFFANDPYRDGVHSRPRVAARTGLPSLARASGLSSCTPAVLRALVSRFGLRVISGHRPGARVAGSGRVSNHAYCNGVRGAVDAGGGNMRGAIAYARAVGLGVGTYSGRLRHVHFSTQAHERYHRHTGGRKRR